MKLNLLLVSALIFFALNGITQKTDTSFQLLWYNGKKINDTSLVTATGNTISYSPSRNDVTVMLAEKNDRVLGLKRAISDPSKLADKVKEMFRGQSEGIMRDAIVSQVDVAVAEVVQQFQTVFDNHISLGGTNPSVDRSASRNSKPQAVPNNIKDMYNDVLKYVEKIRAQPNFKIPEPPGMYYDYCYPCDTARQIAFKRDSGMFIETYLGEESANVYKAVQVMGYFQDLKSAHLPYDSAAAVKMYPAMRLSIYSISLRIYKKLMAVWDRYKSDDHKIYFLVIFLIFEEQWRTYIDPQTILPFPSYAEMAATYIAAVKDILTTAEKESDYAILFNVRGIYKTYATIKALEVEIKAQDIDDFVLPVFFKNDEFDLFIETEAQTSGTGASMSLAKLHSKTRYSVITDKNCHLVWKTPNPNDSKFNYDLDAISMIIFNGESLKYVGTTKFKSPPPTLKLDFCNEKRDTAHFYGFEPDGVESWILKGKEMPTGMSAVLALYMLCFPDIEHYQNVRDPSLLNIAPYNFFFKAPLVNKQKTVFDHTLDGKKLSPQNPYIRYATYRVRIEHVEEK